MEAPRRSFSPRAWLRVFQDPTLTPRRLILLGSLLWVGLTCLLYALADAPSGDPLVNWGVVLVFVGLFVAYQQGAPYAWTAHALVATTVIFVLNAAMATGGINSPAMIWMPIAILPAVMMLNRQATMAWVVGALCLNVLLFVLGQQGWVDVGLGPAQEALWWALSIKIYAVLVLMAVVHLSDRLNRVQRDGIEQSNVALEATHTALAQAQAHKDEFIASVGHELRTPMNAILGLNGILRTELADSPEDLEVVDHIRRSTQQLLQVVNDILDFSQLQAGRLVLHEQDFSIDETVAAVLALFGEKAQAKGLTLTSESLATRPLWVHGDRQRVAQVLKNLIDNAVKFTARGSVHVRTQAVGDGVLFEVQDSGIGIPVDRQQEVFNRFEHADVQTNRQYGGTGLGLAICERLVSLLGGAIGVSSQPGQGTRFWFQLPLHIVATQDVQTAADMARDLAQRALRFLLVDDNMVNLLVARLMLRKCFPLSEITEASNGEQALDLLKQHSFDMVLMDMIMPSMDGIEVTRTVRQDFPEPLCHMPILAVTASANPVDRERCLAAGMNDVLHKPLDQQAVVAMICRHMQGGGA